MDAKVSRHHGTPAQFATSRALRPGALVSALVILLLIIGLGKLSWAAKTYDQHIDEYRIESGR